MFFIVAYFAEDIKMVTDVVAALAPKNCDDLVRLRPKAVDGVYDVSTGRSIIQTYCEFDENGFNWMVRRQNIISLRV